MCRGGFFDEGQDGYSSSFFFQCYLNFETEKSKQQLADSEYGVHLDAQCDLLVTWLDLADAERTVSSA
jgi:hypothetical protein